MEELVLLSVKETAEILKVQEGTIYSWIHYKQLPTDIYRKLGRNVVFIKSELFKWFFAGAQLKKRGEL